ncbi:MAG: class I SAM-dependent methyltransferase [Candidatus Obscuribacterales bacterium]|nr:class I SAM-dependent methyltransferase [Candidatus Obscuribacterales bacterium]
MYTLGSAADEQQRLHAQRELYGDIKGISFAADARICDLGCGPGSNLWLAAQSKSGFYMGVDIQAEQVSAGRLAAQALGLSNVKFKVGDATATGFPGSSMDAVFVRCLLVHLPDPQAVVREASRLLHTGGRVVLIEPNDLSVNAGPNKKHLLKCWKAYNRFAGKQSLSDVGLKEMLTDCGFKGIVVLPHLVRYDAKDFPACRSLMNNWLQMIERVSAQLIEAELITAGDLQSARGEAQAVTNNTFAEIVIWRAFACK